MPKQENTAINQLLGSRSRSPGAEMPARPRPARYGASLEPSGPAIAALPRRRAPAATPPQVPLHSDYSDDAATTVDPPHGWGAYPVVQPTPPPLPPPPPQAAIRPPRPDYPAPHQPPAYYQAPDPEHLDTMRVRELPFAPARSLGTEVLEWVAKLWMPFVALGVIALTLGVYRLVTDKTEPPAITSEPAIVQTSAPAPEPVGSAEPVAADDHGVPKDSLWQPTKAQPTLAPRVETVAAIESEPAIEFEPAVARAPAARPSSDRASSRRAAKRAAAKRSADKQRAKQVALAELAPTPAKAKIEKPETRVVAIAAAKPMKIGAASAASTKGAGAGKLSVDSTPATLIYVDGRNTGMMTPKTLSLPEGSHKITLLSPKDRIAKTIAVEIEAGKSASLSRTFTK